MHKQCAFVSFLQERQLQFLHDVVSTFFDETRKRFICMLSFTFSLAFSHSSNCPGYSGKFISPWNRSRSPEIRWTQSPVDPCAIWPPWSGCFFDLTKWWKFWWVTMCKHMGGVNFHGGTGAKWFFVSTTCCCFFYTNRRVSKLPFTTKSQADAHAPAASTEMAERQGQFFLHHFCDNVYRKIHMAKARCAR